MRNLNTHIKIVLIVLAMFGLANFANAQRKATRVIDNKGNIKYVLDSSSKVIDTGYNGLTKLNDTTLVLGGQLNQNTTIDFNGNSLAFKNSPIGLKADSLLTIDASGNIRHIGADSLLNNIIGANGLTKNGDSIKLGGALNQPTTITATSGNNLTLATTGTGAINITGLTSGSTTDSIAVINPSNGQLQYISATTLLNNLYANNGLTKVADSVQLGGSLTKNTTIDLTANNANLTIAAGSGADSLNITNLPTTTGSNTNLVVVDATTGKLQQMVGTSLLQSGEGTYSENTGQGATSFTLTTTQITGLAGISSTVSKCWVYRNGAKLIQGIDFTIGTNSITLTPVSTGNGSWSDAAGDVYEVQWVK